MRVKETEKRKIQRQTQEDFCEAMQADLAGHHIMLHLNAATRCFDVFLGDQFVKSLPIKGLCGEPMPLENYLDLMRERARSQERQRMIRQR